MQAYKHFMRLTIKISNELTELDLTYDVQFVSVRFMTFDFLSLLNVSGKSVT